MQVCLLPELHHGLHGLSQEKLLATRVSFLKIAKDLLHNVGVVALALEPLLSNDDNGKNNDND